MALQGDGKIVAVGAPLRRRSDFALARYNPNGSLDTSFSGDGRQTTDFARSSAAIGVALQGDGKIVAVGGGGLAATATSSSPATTRTGRSTRASPATAGREPTSGASTGERGGAPGRRQDRRGRGRPRHRPNQRFRACPLSGGLSQARVETLGGHHPDGSGYRRVRPTVTELLRWARLVSNQRPLACEAGRSSRFQGPESASPSGMRRIGCGLMPIRPSDYQGLRHDYQGFGQKEGDFLPSAQREQAPGGMDAIRRPLPAYT